jgi:NADH-quinone oxidoreductase subunit H
MAAVVLAILAFLALYAGVTSVVERKIAGRIQSRFGPNHVFLHGYAQFVADILKSLQKEDIIPLKADAILFRLAPYIVFVGMFLAWVVLPFGAGVSAADLNIGILYLFAVSAYITIGVLMAGWASNNKWSLIGGMRAAAQIVSYEIPSGLSALTVILLSGTLSMQEIVAGQGAYPWEWNITQNPFMPIAFVILFIALLAEGNRTPFDLPESESELVGGYTTEYSGVRFIVFFLAEWANLYVISAVISALFLGGWNSPFIVSIDLMGQNVELTGMLLFFLKVVALTFVIILIRWTLPRLRIDQLMSVCWKYLIPVAFVNIAGVLAWMTLFQEPNPYVTGAMSALVFAPMVLFVYRVVMNLVRMRAGRELIFNR